MKVLVVSPHPDDETLGAGGTILRLINEGHKVSWLNITGIYKSRKFPDNIKQQRKSQIKHIKNYYKFSSCFDLMLPAAGLDGYDTCDAIEKISSVIKKLEPEMLIIPDYNDAHSDHKKVFDRCYASSKVFRFPYIKKIVCMEIISETDFGRPENPFIPNYYIDITKYIENKLEACAIYNTEIGESPFPRNLENIRALAALRGSAAGVRYAEAFRIIKYIM